MEYKAKKQNPNYKSINRTAAEDTRLSLKAKGVMFYLLSKPDGWKGQRYDIIKNCKDGKKSVQTAIDQLKELGYIKTVAIFKDGVFKGKYYEIKDEI